ncbi:MAG: ATP-binding protein [Gammaproteobacteria bacterium]|nr:ATP-binding protein [Gammaproteobacteria bacterium]
MSEPEERWLQQYGLDRDPFPEAETPVDFFSRGGREKQMELLADMASLGRPLVAVIGESGVGKSTFFHNLLRRLPEQARVARVTAGVFLSSKALLQAIGRAMGVEADPDADPDQSIETLRGRLHASIRDRAAAGTPCVIMVDDAGELEGDALAELLSLSELGLGEQPVRVHPVRSPRRARCPGPGHRCVPGRWSGPRDDAGPLQSQRTARLPAVPAGASGPEGRLALLRRGLPGDLPALGRAARPGQRRSPGACCGNRPHPASRRCRCAGWRAAWPRRCCSGPSCCCCLRGMMAIRRT